MTRVSPFSLCTGTSRSVMVVTGTTLVPRRRSSRHVAFRHDRRSPTTHRGGSASRSSAEQPEVPAHATYVDGRSGEVFDSGARTRAALRRRAYDARDGAACDDAEVRDHARRLRSADLRNPRPARRPTSLGERPLPRRPRRGTCAGTRRGPRVGQGRRVERRRARARQRDLRGDLVAWIEIGSPSPDRVHKASKAAPRVAIYAWKNPEQLAEAIREREVHKADHRTQRAARRVSTRSRAHWTA